MDLIVYIILIVLFLKLPTEKDRRTKEILEQCKQDSEEHIKALKEYEKYYTRGNRND